MAILIKRWRTSLNIRLKAKIGWFRDFIGIKLIKIKMTFLNFILEDLKLKLRMRVSNNPFLLKIP